MNNKQNRYPARGLRSALCGLLVAGVASMALAQNTSTTNTFDIASSTTSFVNNWWGIGPTITWDATRDAANDPLSGSVRYDAPFTGVLGQQFMTHFTIANRWGWDAGTVIDATTYTNLSFDIKVDPVSAITPGGNYGSLEIGLTSYPSANTWNPMTTVGWNIPLSATNWTHHDIPINPIWGGLNTVVGVYIKMWSNGAHTNTLSFNLDNVMITKPTVPVVIPPPTVALSKATSGLNLINTTNAGANGRQNIHPISPSYSWVGVPNPVSFKITIKDYPALPTGYQTHLFLAPSNSLPYGAGDTSVDWNCTNLVFVQIQSITNGGQMTFMYKTNFGSGWGGQVFGSNNLGAVFSSVLKGTWTIAFNNDTNISLTAPDNTTTNLIMPPDSAANFGGSVFAWIGSQANGDNKVGLSSVIEKIEITGFPSGNVSDNFLGTALDTNVWVNSANDAGGVQVVAANTAHWLDWTVPDNGFRPQSSPVVGPGTVWTDLDATLVLFNSKRHAQVSSVTSDNGYYRLIKRTFSQLQVLLPGESPAPNTPTGKTGTPGPINLNVDPTMAVTVRAVDAEWNLVNSSDTIHLAVSDPLGFTPADAAMVNGVVTFTAFDSIYFGSTGTFTVTATNMSRVMPEATSSPVTVQ